MRQSTRPTTAPSAGGHALLALVFLATATPALRASPPPILRQLRGYRSLLPLQLSTDRGRSWSDCPMVDEKGGAYRCRFVLPDGKGAFFALAYPEAEHRGPDRSFRRFDLHPADRRWIAGPRAFSSKGAPTHAGPLEFVKTEHSASLQAYTYFSVLSRDGGRVWTTRPLKDPKRLAQVFGRRPSPRIAASIGPLARRALAWSKKHGYVHNWVEADLHPTKNDVAVLTLSFASGPAPPPLPGRPRRPVVVLTRDGGRSLRPVPCIDAVPGEGSTSCQGVYAGSSISVSVIEGHAPHGGSSGTRVWNSKIRYSYDFGRHWSDLPAPDLVADRHFVFGVAWPGYRPPRPP